MVLLIQSVAAKSVWERTGSLVFYSGHGVHLAMLICI